VRLLSQQSFQEHHEKIDNLPSDVNPISSSIMDITVRIMGHPRKMYQDLERDLIESVIKRAICYSCVLRRQQSRIGVVMPTSQKDLYNKGSEQRNVPPVPPDEDSRDSEQSFQEAGIFIHPKLLRCSTITGEALEESVTVIEPEKCQLPLTRCKEDRREARQIAYSGF
jgi:hypothetical protein